MPPGYDDIVTIDFKLQNPEDNWGTVGFKIRTFETVATGVVDPAEIGYMVDKHENNELIPLLQCNTPCESCPFDEGTGETINRDYCTRCWKSRPQKYLMTYLPFDEFLLTDLSQPNTCDS